MYIAHPQSWNIQSMLIMMNDVQSHPDFVAIEILVGVVSFLSVTRVLCHTSSVRYTSNDEDELEMNERTKTNRSCNVMINTLLHLVFSWAN